MKVCLQEVPTKLKDASTERRKLQKGISEYCDILERNAEKQADFFRFKNNDMNILPPAIDFNSNAIVDISDSDSLIYKSFSLDSIEDDNNVMMADKTDQSDAVQHDGPLLVDQIPVKSFIHLLSGKHLRHYRTNSASMQADFRNAVEQTDVFNQMIYTGNTSIVKQALSMLYMIFDHDGKKENVMGRMMMLQAKPSIPKMLCQMMYAFLLTVEGERKSKGGEDQDREKIDLTCEKLEKDLKDQSLLRVQAFNNQLPRTPSKAENENSFQSIALAAMLSLVDYNHPGDEKEKEKAIIKALTSMDGLQAMKQKMDEYNPPRVSAEKAAELDAAKAVVDAYLKYHTESDNDQPKALPKDVEGQPKDVEDQSEKQKKSEKMTQKYKGVATDEMAVDVDDASQPKAQKKSDQMKLKDSPAAGIHAKHAESDKMAVDAQTEVQEESQKETQTVKPAACDAGNTEETITEAEKPTDKKSADPEQEPDGSKVIEAVANDPASAVQTERKKDKGKMDEASQKAAADKPSAEGQDGNNITAQDVGQQEGDTEGAKQAQGSQAETNKKTEKQAGKKRKVTQPETSNKRATRASTSQAKKNK